MRALTTTEICARYNFSRSTLERLVECGLVFRLGIPGGRVQRYLDPSAEFMLRILNRNTFCDNARWLTVADLAAYFGVPRRTVQKWVRRGKLKSTFVENRNWFSIEDVRDLLRHYSIRRTTAPRTLKARLGPAPKRNLSFKEQGLPKASVSNSAEMHTK
jgi:excisionase family DNA binding protein